MSFILDALKKSETDRQQQGSAEFAAVPTSSRREGAPRWLWVLGLLLAVNFLVLLGLLLRPDTSSALPAAPTGASQITPVQADSTEQFAERVAAARQKTPLRDDPPPAADNTARAEAPSGSAASTLSSSMALPTIHEVVANGTLSLPELHVDIHVYSEIAKDRFVFINMNKHKEGTRLAEGPLVKEITPEGVVLNQNGILFLLPRD